MDMTDDKPPEKPTVEFDRPPAWAISMMERQQEGFATLRTEMENRFDRTDANIEVVSNDLKVTKDRVALLESRADTSSMRAKQPSETDLGIQAKLAAEISEREAVGKKVDALSTQLAEATSAQTTQIINGVRDALRTPLGQKVVTLLTILVGIAIAAASGYAARGNAPAQQPTHQVSP